MRKNKKWILCCLMAVVLAGCGGSQGSNDRSANQATWVAEVLQQGIEEAAETTAAGGAEDSAAETTAQTQATDTAAESAAETQTADTAAESAAETQTAETAAAESAAETQASDAGAAENAAEAVEAATGSGAGAPARIDVDLTALSSTMVYSEVNNMMVSPEDYMGKMVKMVGPFSVYHDEATKKDYFACIIEDATACCAQGIEFVLAGDAVYPEDYPEEGEVITVTGTFDTYTEGEYTYVTLRNAKIL